MENLLATIDARKEELAKLGPLRTEDEERLWKKFRLEWNYNSNHIEGNTLTYQETELILIFDQAPGGSHTVREIEEMKAHDVAIALVREWAADEKRELTEADIRDLNRILLVRPFWKEALTFDGQPTRRLISIGEYKKYPNSVRLSNGEMFHYASPEETPRKMQELTAWYRETSQKQHPVIVAARLHYDFVRIHPFDDGNGRGARLLMNYHLLRHGFPPVIIKSVDKKEGYFAALQRADVGDFEAFVSYIAQQMLWPLDLSIRASKAESVEEPRDWQKELILLGKGTKGEAKVQEISNQLVYDRIKDSIFPIYDLIFEGIVDAVNTLFDKVDRQFVIHILNFAAPQMSSHTELIESVYQQQVLSRIGNINMYFYCNGFVPNPSLSNNFSLYLTVKFEPYQYIIEFSNHTVFRGNYTVTIPKSKQEEIVEVIGKFLLERIKDRFSPK